MTTYTIATYDGILVATAPDGDDAMMASRIAAEIGNLNDCNDGEPITADDLDYTSGLTLFETMADAYEGDVELVWVGNDHGFLEDEGGQMIYFAAGRVPA